MDKEASAKIFTDALVFEEEGYKMYQEAAAKTSDPLGKATLESLAADEMEHQELIKKFAQSLQDNSASLNVDKLIPQRPEGYGTITFPKELKDKVGKDNSILELLGIAMELEAKGYTFYEKALEDCADENTRKILTFLVAEEKRHFALLQNSSEYIKDPASWFVENENPMFEG